MNWLTFSALVGACFLSFMFGISHGKKIALERIPPDMDLIQARVEYTRTDAGWRMQIIKKGEPETLLFEQFVRRDNLLP